MTPTGTIVVSSLNWAKRHKRGFDAVLTLEDPRRRPNEALRFHREPHPDHLILRFVDMDRPAPPPHEEELDFRLATRDDVERGIAFGLRRDRLLVHCHAGVGRSPAMALAIIAARLGAGREGEAVDEMLKIAPRAVPNLHVVSLADDVLGCGGALLATVTAWDETRSENATRRVKNRRAHFYSAGLCPWSDSGTPLPTDL